MKIEDILESGADVTIKMRSADLKEFADNLAKKVVGSIKDSLIKPESTYITINEASEMLHVGKSTLWRWHKMGYLSHREIGGKRLYLKNDIDSILRQKNMITI